MHVMLRSPCLIAGMENETRKGLETLGEAAARLLRRLEQRANKSGRSSAGKGAGEDGAGGVALDPRQHSAVRGGGTVLNAANDDGRPVCSAVSFQWGRHGDHGLPDRDEGTMRADRANVTLPVID